MKRIANREALAAALPRGGDGAELGVLDGRFANMLWAMAKPRTLHLVDRWEGIYPGVRTIDGQDREGIPADWSLAQVNRLFAGELAAGSVVMHQADSVQWLGSRPASSLDWLYLDSDHSDHHVFRELCQALRVVKAGGWICGHDYSAAVPGVVSAVDRFNLFHGQSIDSLTDEPENDILSRGSQAWQPKRCAFNSYAIQVRK